VGPATSSTWGKVRGDEDDDDGSACGWVDAALSPMPCPCLAAIIDEAVGARDRAPAAHRRPSESRQHEQANEKPRPEVQAGGVLKYLLTSPKRCQHPS